MKARIAGLAAVAALGMGLVAAPAHAMGTGNPYLDLQTGVTYTVYKPTYTAGLPTRHVGGNTAGAPGVEENLVASFGTKKGPNITITEGNPMSSDIGTGRLVKSLTVQGHPAKVFAYCDPASTAACTIADVAKAGGYVQVMLPAAKGLRRTNVWVETSVPKPVSGNVLIKVAEGLRPVQ
jgi:hypothetical protein